MMEKYVITSKALWDACIATIALLVSTSVGAQTFPSYTTLLDGQVLPGVVVDMLSNSDKLFPVNVVPRGGAVRPLQYAKNKLQKVTFKSDDKNYDLYDYVTNNRVAGLLVLKNGEIVFEDYELGATPNTRWASFSMAKSMTSTLIGAALKQGRIQSLDEPVTKYVPALREGVYDTVSIRNVLQMASGVAWDETYANPNSEQRQMTLVRLQEKPGALMGFMSKLQRAAPPGSVWNYNTGETVVAGAVVEGAMGKSLASLLSEIVWSKLGMEHDAYWALESRGGMGFGGAGIGATLRDYGRFGQMVLDDGVTDGQRIVPEGWFRLASRASTIGGKKVNYGYQWWLPNSTDPINQTAFNAQGIFGQYMYINPEEKLVIIVLSARPKARLGARMVDDMAFFSAVAHALH